MPYLTCALGRLHARTWHTVAPVLAQVVLLHGLGEHSGRYEQFAGQVARSGIEVHVLDLPGHGRSYGRPGQVQDVDHLVRGARQLVRSVQRLYPGVPTAVAGHSLGALVALLLADVLDRERRATPEAAPALNALVLSAAPLAPVTDPDRLRLGSAKDGFVTRPGRVGGTTIAALRHGWHRTADILSGGGPDVATLLLHGRQDQVVPLAAARFNAARLERASLIELPGGGHDLPTGLDAHPVGQRLVEFLLSSQATVTAVSPGRE